MSEADTASAMKDMLEYGRAFTDFWTAGTRAFLSAQENAGKMLAARMQQASAASEATTATDGVSKAGQAFAELWSAAGTLATSLANKLPAGMADGSALDPTVEATFRKMLDPATWLAGTSEMDQVVTRMAEGPRFADLWDVERRQARLFQAWMELRLRSLEHAAVTMQAWLRAGQTFAEQTKDAGEKKEGRALLDLWTGIANHELLETQRSQPFLASQAAMIRASTAFKVTQRELAEYYGEQFGIPTRTELDDVHRTVTELRRELRAMQRRQQRAAETPPSARPEAIAPATKPQRPRKEKASS